MMSYVVVDQKLYGIAEPFNCYDLILQILSLRYLIRFLYSENEDCSCVVEPSQIYSHRAKFEMRSIEREYFTNFYITFLHLFHDSSGFILSKNTESA